VNASAGPSRLPAAERRSGIVRAAVEVFAQRGFGAATTAQIAAAAGVNEALLFRHLGSKRGLFRAAIDAAWVEVREACESAFASEPDPALHWRSMGSTFLALATTDPHPARLWSRALTETTGVEEIDQHLVELMWEVHAFATATIERSQSAGGVQPEREPGAEAWIVIALGLLGTVGERLGPVLGDDFSRALASHREWLTGTAE